MERTFKRVKNYNVSVREVKGKVVFLRTLQRGGSEHSFGIHVARLAGMPAAIVQRAEVVLQQLEANRSSVNTPDTAALQPAGGEGMQLSFFQLDDPVLMQIRDEILTLQIDSLTPLEALNKLHEIQRIVKGTSH